MFELQPAFYASKREKKKSFRMRHLTIIFDFQFDQFKDTEDEVEEGDEKNSIKKTQIQLQFSAGVFVQVTTGEPKEAGKVW